MSPVVSAAVMVRRMLVRRPWIYWSVAALAALGSAAGIVERSDRIDAARASWGRTTTVWVATRDLAAGDPLTAERRELPAAMVAPTAADTVDGLVARQQIATGEIVHEIDLVAPDGPAALTPAGWRAVPVIESPPSGALVGDRVDVVSDGVVVSAAALVVGHHDAATLVAVPEHIAPVLPAAADTGHVTLLLRP